MPLELQNTPLTPNSIIVPSITAFTRVQEDGSLRTGCTVELQAANVSTEGVWTPIGDVKSITLHNVEALPEDLASLQTTVLQAMGGMLMLVDAVNQIRKVV